MRRTRASLATASAALVLAGCSSQLIFRTGFSAGTGSPAGPPFGSPADDQITVQDPGNPVLTSGALTFSPPHGKWAYFFSHPVDPAKTTKTIFWKGQLTGGGGPFVAFVTAHASVGTPFPVEPLEIRLGSTSVEIRAANGNLLHSSPLVAGDPHDVFVALRLSTDTYRITVQQPSAPQIEFTGSLPPATANTLKTNARITLHAGFGLNTSGSQTYVMDDVIMRERN